MSVKACATVDFLKKASIYYRDICPEQSRFLMRLQQHMKVETEPDEVLCPFCFQWRHAHDCRVRIKPKRKPSLLIQKILKLEAAHVRLSPEQLKTLRRFQKTSNTLMATCHTCNKTSKSCGVGRDTVRALSKTQNTPGKPRTVTPTPCSGGGKASTKSVEKTAYGTPRSASSESGSASKRSDTKKSTFSRLRKILTLSETPKKEKGGLKAFLSSL